MNAKSLPLLVIRELSEISKYLKTAIEQSNLPLTLKPRSKFGFTVEYTPSPDLHFDLTNFSFSNEESTIFYKIKKAPLNSHTSITESENFFEELDLEDISIEFENWIDLMKEYESLHNINVSDLFRIEDDQQFLQPEPDTFSKKDDVLSFCLKSLSVSNFQGIKRASIENLPIDTSWVFLVGENGFGKSTILQSIALGLHGTKDGSYNYGNGDGSRIKVEYKNEDQNLINDFKTNPFSLPHLATYGPVRLNMQVDATMHEAAQKSGTLYSLFQTDGVLLNIESEFIKWVLKDDDRFKLVRNSFLKLVPNLADIRFNSDNDRIEYIEKDVIEGLEKYDPLPFEKIASGFRSILGMAGDMIVRLSNSQKEVTNPADLKGIVIIDELDLHWHPKLQKQIPELFNEVFPNIQFIVSTHSPIPLLGAPKNSVILKVNRTKEQGITIQKVDIDLKTLTPNLLLTSGVFDMDNIFSSQIDTLEEVRTEDTFDEMAKNDSVDEYLKNFEQNDQEFPDELFQPTKK